MMLNELGIKKRKRIKCNAHVLFAFEVALDKVFKGMETMMVYPTLYQKVF